MKNKKIKIEGVTRTTRHLEYEFSDERQSSRSRLLHISIQDYAHERPIFYSYTPKTINKSTINYQCIHFNRKKEGTAV